MSDFMARTVGTARKSSASGIKRAKIRSGNLKHLPNRPILKQCSSPKVEQQRDTNRTHGASHRGMKLNSWSEENMLEVLKEFNEQKEKPHSGKESGSWKPNTK